MPEEIIEAIEKLDLGKKGIPRIERHDVPSEDFIQKALPNIDMRQMQSNMPFSFR